MYILDIRNKKLYTDYNWDKLSKSYYPDYYYTCPVYTLLAAENQELNQNITKIPQVMHNLLVYLNIISDIRVSAGIYYNRRSSTSQYAKLPASI